MEDAFAYSDTLMYVASYSICAFQLIADFEHHLAVMVTYSNVYNNYVNVVIKHIHG